MPGKLTAEKIVELQTVLWHRDFHATMARWAELVLHFQTAMIEADGSKGNHHPPLPWGDEVHGLLMEEAAEAKRDALASKLVRRDRAAETVAARLLSGRTHKQAGGRPPSFELERYAALLLAEIYLHYTGQNPTASHRGKKQPAVSAHVTKQSVSKFDAFARQSFEAIGLTCAPTVLRELAGVMRSLREADRRALKQRLLLL